MGRVGYGPRCPVTLRSSRVIFILRWFDNNMSTKAPSNTIRAFYIDLQAKQTTVYNHIVCAQTNA